MTGGDGALLLQTPWSVNPRTACPAAADPLEREAAYVRQVLAPLLGSQGVCEGVRVGRGGRVGGA